MGGFGYSTNAVEKYNKRLPAGERKISVEFNIGPVAIALTEEMKLEAGSNAVNEKCTWDIDRGDPLMVQICSELGKEANGEYSKIAIAQVPRKFEKHYVIGEYDGLENVQIDFRGYQPDRIKCIMNDDSTSSDDKVRMPQDVFLEKENGDAGAD